MKGAICYNESGYFTVSFHAFHLKTLKIIQHDFLTNARKKIKAVESIGVIVALEASLLGQILVFKTSNFHEEATSGYFHNQKNLFCLIRHGYLMENWLEFTERKH